MRIEYGINPNCSEAVFRFYTLEPKKIHTILQSIANEISNETDFTPHKKQKIPLLKNADDYDTNYHKATNQEYDTHYKIISVLAAKRNKQNATKKEIAEAEKALKIEYERFRKLQYRNSVSLKACAGLGDNDAIITVEKENGSFRLNIGNNDIQNNKTNWIEKVKALDIKIEEAEVGENNLKDYARDCTCGVVFFE